MLRLSNSVHLNRKESSSLTIMKITKNSKQNIVVSIHVPSRERRKIVPLSDETTLNLLIRIVEVCNVIFSSFWQKSYYHVYGANN